MVATAEKFLFAYTFFLFFIIFLISLGFSGFGGNIVDLTSPSLPIGEINVLTFLAFVFDNVLFFFTLMSVDTGIFFLGLLIFSPAIFVLLFIMLKLIRGVS